MFWRGLGGTKLALGASGSGIAVVALIGLLLLAFGKCNFLFHPVASIRSTPTPTTSTAAEGTPTLSAGATSTPTAASTPTATATPTPTAAPTSTPTTTPTATPTPGPSQLIITSLPWHVGEVNISYALVNLGASGGTPPYNWSISSGALPAGLTLSTGGTVTGVPISGAGAFTVHVADAGGQAAGVSTSINIVPYLTANDVCGPNGCTAEAGCAAVCGNYTAPINGIGPYQYTLVGANPVPPGTTFAGPSLGGTFNQVGGFQFSVDVTDSMGAKASVSPLFNVLPHLILIGGQFTGPITGFKFTMPFRGGIAPITNMSFSPKLAMHDLNGNPNDSVLGQFRTQHGDSNRWAN